MTVLTGKSTIVQLCEEAIQKTAKLTAAGIKPCLAILRVGEKPDDIYYENSAVKRMEGIGIAVRQIHKPEATTTEQLILELEKLNVDASVHGVLLLMPLPAHIDAAAVKASLSPKKDIDCLTAENMAKIYADDSTGFAPCTPAAVMALLQCNSIDLRGKNVTVIGRSLVVGKPLSMLLLSKNATVTICHSRTKDLAAVCRQADILIAAVGRARMVNANFVKPGAVVIDVGINVDEKGQMCGDVDFDAVAEIAEAVTPVPGGIGGITTAVLAQNLLKAAELQADPL